MRKNKDDSIYYKCRVLDKNEKECKASMTINKNEIVSRYKFIHHEEPKHNYTEIGLMVRVAILEMKDLVTKNRTSAEQIYNSIYAKVVIELSENFKDSSVQDKEKY